jgi:hypothetical protein
MVPSWIELAAIVMLILSGVGVRFFLVHLNHIRELSANMVEVPLDESHEQSRRRGNIQYESQAETMRMSEWDALPPDEKLKKRRRAELWSIFVGVCFIVAIILGYFVFWASTNYPPEHWLNRPIA